MVLMMSWSGADAGMALAASPSVPRSLYTGEAASRSEELSLGVCPEIFRGRADEHGPRRDQGNQLVLVHGEPILAAVVRVKIGAEPVGEAGIDAQR